MRMHLGRTGIAQRVAAVAALAGVAVLPLPGADDDWDNLKVLRAGDRVEVIEKTGKRISGKFVNNSTSALTVDVAGVQRSLESNTVVRVSRLGRSHRVRNAILLGIAGAAVGAGAKKFGAACNESDTGCRDAMLAAVIGGAAGAAVGALILPRPETIYRVRQVGRP